MRTYMQKFQARRAAGEKGFTLIELLVVIVIIGILAAIAVPVFLSQRSNAYEASLKSDVANAAKVMEGAFVEPTGYTTSGVTFLKDASTTLTVFVCPAAPGNKTSFIINGTSSRIAGTNAVVYNSATGGLVSNGALVTPATACS